ncbi:StsB family radical SAM/SPASM domain sactipeptide maturase [Streptomyces olivoreticuli]|uniref:StsB family radical SAM/SPASM domain sactipeptide maturase n=1 Tax=Streptomyces olivoreticuli TaxID=68246 RepID=UPI000E2774C4|nr:StsB family radical SAM/SPASM domain sactipeptide maturase [Streptomyces olivoreticuli]
MKLLEQWDELVVPEDLVYFRNSEGHEGHLVTNPELAAWCLLTAPELKVLQALAQPGAGLPQGTAPAEAERTLARVILKFIVYLPGRRPKVRPPDPQLSTVYYAITDGCNLRCPYCYASSEKCLPGELSTEESLDLMDQIAAMGVRTVIFTGGEPMLRKDLFRVAEYARGLGLAVNVISNGTLIRRPETARRISGIFHTVTVSMDGGTAETHEQTRGRGTFARTARGLRLLNDAGVIPTINHVVTPDNVDVLDKLCEFAADLKIRQVRLMYHSDLGRAASDEYDFGWTEFQKIEEFIWTNPMAKNLLPDGPKGAKPCSIKGNCGMGGNEIYVNSLGDVYPCKLVTKPLHRAGNVRHQRLADLFTSPLLENLRGSNVFSGENLRDCRHCYIRAACGGGCRAYHMAETGDIHRNGRHLCRILRRSMITNWWVAAGATGRQLAEHRDEMFRPLLVRDDSVHPVHEDWKTGGRRLLPIVPA